MYKRQVLGYTCVNIPYGTLCGAMTQDIDERAKINTSRSVAAMIAIGIINIITVPLIGKLGSQSAKNGYLFVAIIYGCIFAACHFFCFAKTKEQVTIPEKEKISIKVQLKAVMQNSCLLYTSSVRDIRHRLVCLLLRQDISPEESQRVLPEYMR